MLAYLKTQWSFHLEPLRSHSSPTAHYLSHCSSLPLITFHLSLVNQQILGLGVHGHYNLTLWLIHMYLQGIVLLPTTKIQAHSNVLKLEH